MNMLQQHIKQGWQYFSSIPKSSQKLTAVLAIILVAGVGTYLIMGSHAASPYVSTTADNGQLSAGASTQLCAGASDGNCVVFGGSNNGGSQTDCILSPHICGYPDMTDSGLPAGTSLIDLPPGDIIVEPNQVVLTECALYVYPCSNSGTYETLGPSQGVTMNGGNITISNIHFEGTMEIQASNVTIDDSDITSPFVSGWAIQVAANLDGNGSEPAVENTLIENSTFGGIDSSLYSVNFGVVNEGNTAALTANKDVMLNCSSCFDGSGKLTNSFLDNFNYVAPAHNEDVQWQGNADSSDALDVENNTLLNAEDQTAAVFTQPQNGPDDNIIIKNNLVGGGDYTLQGPYAPSSGFSNCPNNVIFEDNRFSSVFYTLGGQYGPLSGDASACGGSDITTGNYWDTNNLPISDSPNTGVSDPTSPNPPTNLHITGTPSCSVDTSDEVDLAWNAGSATTKYGLWGYIIYRTPSQDEYGSAPGGINATQATSYVDTGLYDSDSGTERMTPDPNIVCGTSYTYDVTAVDANGRQSSPATVNVTLPN